MGWTTILRSMLLGVCLLCLCLLEAAAEHHDDAAGPRHWESALEFRFNDEFRLNDLVGVSVSWKGYHGERGGWRFGLTPELLESDMVEPERSRRYRRRALILEGQRLGFVNVRDLAKLCLGLGVMGGLGRESDGWGSGEVGAFQEKWTIHRYQAGLIGTAGLERLVAGRVVLGVEYGLDAVMERRRLNDIRWDDEESDFVFTKDWKSSFSVRSRRVAITVGIIF